MNVAAEGTNYTILVDQFCLNSNWTLDFVRARAEDPLCRLILLLPYPEHEDRDLDSATRDLFDVIVRNTGNKPHLDFKLHALDVIRATSDYHVVAAIDFQVGMRFRYDEEQVPFVMDERGVLL